MAVKSKKLEKFNLRKTWRPETHIIQMPNLIDVQCLSYKKFLQENSLPDERKNIGLQAVFTSFFPIIDYKKNFKLEYVRYYFESPRYNIKQSIKRGISYTLFLRIVLRFIHYIEDPDTGELSVDTVKEQDLFLLDLPLMTPTGTFIINGTERVIISQLHRSPGVIFEKLPSKTVSNRETTSTHIIPSRGSWLDFEIDSKDVIFMRIDRKRKLPVTTLLMALDDDKSEVERSRGTLDVESVTSYTKQDILHMFYPFADFINEKKGFVGKSVDCLFPGIRLPFNLYDVTGKTIILNRGKRISHALHTKIVQEHSKILVQKEDFAGHILASDLLNNETGEVLKSAGEVLDIDFLDSLQDLGISILPIILHDFAGKNLAIRNTIMMDKNNNRAEALQDIYRIIHPGEPFQLERADTMLVNMFFNPSYYDLSNVGRYKMDMRLGHKEHMSQQDGSYLLKKEDIFDVLKYLVGLRDGIGYFDDIDSLENRRVRSIGELLETQFRMGLLRMERSFRERVILSTENDTILPQDMINTKSLASIIREFFNSSQLSQFMDQTNPISEITHKRRLSALGPGGLVRDRAGFEVRDVHPTHYGRICPIETPEGPNIGLINSLATFARVNDYGLIETPYRRVEDGKLTDDVEYMSAIEEKGNVIAEANVSVKDNEIQGDLVAGRKNFENIYADAKDVNYIEVSPRQLVSAAAALIPFLENDDANRALMGSNMQRQAVPLLNARSPLVGTGFENKIAMDSGNVLLAENDGVVQLVDSNRIVVKLQHPKKHHVVDIYALSKFQRSNQNTCLNQKPVVSRGDVIQKGDIIADGAATEYGELALGTNMLVAFMPWQGYNFEDSILLSERIVKEDVLTSFHIEKYEIMARDTKLGPEEITRDIPGMSQHALRNLDESGIVYEGAYVASGDVLVGKVTPKGETVLTAEEKLLMAIFGEKASDVQNSSLTMPPGQEGIVVSVQIFNREGVAKDERSILIEQKQEMLLESDFKLEHKILENIYKDQMIDLLVGLNIQKSSTKGLASNIPLRKEDLVLLTVSKLANLNIEDKKIKQNLQTFKEEFDLASKQLKSSFQTKLQKEQTGEDMPLGMLKMVRIFVAVKRKIQPGDKMAGRHGNKGVVSRIMPVEDMPYMEDGTPVDIVLNPLGVPSRMNLGQILETHVGFASLELGKRLRNLLELYKDKKVNLSDITSTIEGIYDNKNALKDASDAEVLKIAERLSNGVFVASPVFNGLSNKEINQWLEKADIQSSGQVTLYDGRTGEAFERPVTVGGIYMMKLNHLVDDKIHARSVGPYSFITQQPLGGKSQFGGQRFGEMEVWALEAYGAAYTLLEIQTYKSDFIEGRARVMDGIVQGRDSFISGIPESFKVLIKEMQGLGLNVELLQTAQSKQMKIVEENIEDQDTNE